MGSINIDLRIEVKEGRCLATLNGQPAMTLDMVAMVRAMLEGSPVLILAEAEHRDAADRVAAQMSQMAPLITHILTEHGGATQEDAIRLLGRATALVETRVTMEWPDAAVPPALTAPGIEPPPWYGRLARES